MAEEKKIDVNSNLEISNESNLKGDKMEQTSEQHPEHHSEHHSKPGFKISKLKVYQIATFVLAIALITAVAAYFMGAIPGSATSGDKTAIADKTVKYLNDNFGTTATVKTIAEKNGIYALSLDIKGQETTVYVTKDGEMIFPVAIDKNAKEAQAAEQQTATASAEMTKSDKPVVELFVMTHCPYGTQMEKGILPVVELLGNKIDFSIKWVYYSMHGQTELNEELVQYCVNKEFSSKYLDYLSCFLKDGKTQDCITQTGLDNDTLYACVADTDKQYNVTASLNDQSTWISGRFPQMNIYKADNEKYNIGGSPTLIINGKEASTARDSASLLKAICGAFTTEPSECSTNLSSTAPSSGFGYEGTGTNTAAACGS